jgi:hypothetical protein
MKIYMYEISCDYRVKSSEYRVTTMNGEGAYCRGDKIARLAAMNQSNGGVYLFFRKLTLMEVEKLRRNEGKTDENLSI